MPTLFVFLLKVNAALLLFCAGYYLVLRHLTFYTLNRVYLIGAIIFATIYPQINLDAFFQNHQQLAQPVYVVVDNLQLPAQVLAQPAYWTWLEIVFFAGVVVLAIKLVLQLFSLYTVYRASQKENIHGHEVRIVNGDGGPFSFWRSIYVNPTGYTEQDLRAILKHEQIHTDEWHTIDILLAELSVIFYWFNPGVWLMRKAVRENIEFITDRKILQQGADTKQYQYSLLNVSFTNTKPGIANHFNMSTLKKRIIMMNAKRSSKANLTRYAFLVPLLLVMLLSFSVTRAAIVKTTKITYKTLVSSVNNIVQDNPLTNVVGQFFGDSVAGVNAHKKNDTLKVINVGKKDTIKIIASAITINESGQKDSNKVIHMVNFIGADSNKNKITHVRINGVDYHAVGNGHDFVAAADPGRKGPASKRDTITFRNVVIGEPTIETVYKDTMRYFINGKHDTAKVPFGATIRVRGAAKSDPTHTLLEAIDRVNVITALTPDTSLEKVNALLKRMEGFTVNADGSVTHDNVKGSPELIKKLMLSTAAVNIKRNSNEPITVMGRPLNSKDITISNMDERLILINGKEAISKDVKKLSVSEIIRMGIKDGSPELVKQYGDKAKNGIIMYTTKKQDN